jgi:tripartite-type tricarboxylate transporter receptor subunit TctC
MHRLMVAVAVIACIGCDVYAQSEAYPIRPVRVVNPFTPGGAVDTVARIVVQQLNESWGQPVIIDNRPGAGTTIGTEIVTRAAPDGYTLLLTNGSIATNVTIYKNLSFNPAKDLAPVALVVQSPYVLAVHPAVKATSLQEFVNLAKSKPGQLVYGSTGQGSLAHLTMELLKSHMKIDMLHVPYKGGAPSVTALLGGEIQSIFSPVSAIVPLAKNGKVRALAISSSKRVELAPDLPTVAELGVPGFESISWYPIFAPAKTSLPIIRKINADVNPLVQKPEIRNRFLSMGMVPFTGAPQATHDYLVLEIKRWSQVIVDAGVRPE